jgi:hypothetical protein
MKVVRLLASRTGRLYPQQCSWYSFSVGADSTPGPWYGRKKYVNEISRESIPGPSDNQYATPGPKLQIKVPVNVGKRDNTVTKETSILYPEGRTYLRQTRNIREVKVKAVPFHDKQALRGGRGASLHILGPGARRR